MERKHVSILPKDVPLEAGVPSAASARFLRLPHPRTHQPALFLPYTQGESAERGPREGLLEVQRISLDADKQRCWFIDEEVVSDGSIALFTPFDPVFFAISYLSALQPVFQSHADLWEAIAQRGFETSPGGGSDDSEGVATDQFAEDLGRLGQMERLRERMAVVCDAQGVSSRPPKSSSAAGPQAKALALLRAKVEALVEPDSGIFGPLAPTEPGEERKPLEGDAEGAGPPTFTSVSRGLGKEDVGSGHGLSAQIQIESRQRYAVGIIANYLPASVAKELLGAYDFPALKAYLSLATPNSVVLDMTYLPGRGSAKMAGGISPDDLGGGSAAKKRKAEQSKGSRGVEALKKVNTKGMKSLAELFGKQTAKAPAGKAVSATGTRSKEEPDAGRPAKRRK
ncbi:hypothetical protein JCM8202v2_003649 [Rhodotorula sphaerocarpa]